VAIQFKRAVKSQAKARIGLIGPSGSGKTYTALLLAQAMGERIAVIDTEYGSASKYADEFQFDTLELANFHPQNYIDGIKAAGQAGYDVIIIDSLSHAWAGSRGALELADKGALKYSGNRFAAWRDVTPLHNKLIEAMLSSPAHLIATMRSKMDYIQTQDSKGKTIIRKVGMAPIQRDGMEYEFDIVGDLDIDHNLIISKTRCRALDGVVINKPGKELAETVKAWLSDGEPLPDKPTDAQSTRMMALVKELALDGSYMARLISDEYGKGKYNELTQDEAEGLNEMLEGMRQQAAS
jgi:energy-coupling factor transporter ATP-binding protein EcfA2